jgi:alcohol dehydrogenase (cytochrome c)
VIDRSVAHVGRLAALACFLVAGSAQAQVAGQQSEPAPPPAPPGAAAAPAARAAAPTRGPRNEDATYRQAVGAREAELGKLSPVTDAMLVDPPPGDWLIWRRAYDGQGHSPLDQINKRNVASLSPAWMWSLPVSPDEITPLVHEGVLFVASANRLQALDARSGDLLWQYTRPLPPAQNNGVNAITKNLAIYEDKVFWTTADRHMVAVDMRTGAVAWDHEIVPADVTGLRITGGPLVAKGKVVVGVSSCNNHKGGCFIVGLDARTGNEAWRFHSIARPGEPGGDTWNGAPLDERFGGSVWTSGSYDPALNLIYFGIGQTYDSATLLKPRPGQPEVGANDALYTDATVALDPDTGKVVWHYQHMNRDVWDLDWVFERTLIDLPVDGQVRKLSVTAGKLAIFDAVDRTNGRYLFSKDVGLQNLVASIDPQTGKKIIDPKFAPEAGVTKEICPHAGGARSWPATAYDPKSKVIFVPLVESCMDFTWIDRDAAATAGGGSDLRWVLKPRPDSDGKFGRVEAINLETRKVAWSQRRRAPETSALLHTAGGLLFEGSRDRWFRALDDATGKPLWQVRLSAVPSSFPITYAVGGEQYVAVVAGGGGAHEATWPTLTPEIDNPAGATTLYVFNLPEGR